MSVLIQEVSKWYGAQQALHSVAFEALPGTVTGFLGPNGAGKSTLMKIITGYLEPDAGQVKVCGMPVGRDSIKTKRRIGYLPEHNPLYPELYIREYLSFAAGVHKIRNASARIDELIELTGLGPERSKRIGALSKGYRQRVGLARAMLHNPEVLILDEPTTGLDPNQILEIRELIKRYGENKTVLLSTHIMQEVEAICDRVVIINKGSIVANGETNVLLKNAGGAQKIRVEFSKEVSELQLLSMKGVKSIIREGSAWIIESREGLDLRAEVFRWAVTADVQILTQELIKSDLETLFRELTA